ncbi:MAG: hypothetical protein HRT61_24930, partial [Ekhidna sp.]|nr:hypothetical protein [Ekhidna sp.]
MGHYIKNPTNDIVPTEWSDDEDEGERKIQKYRGLRMHLATHIRDGTNGITYPERSLVYSVLSKSIAEIVSLIPELNKVGEGAWNLLRMVVNYMLNSGVLDYTPGWEDEYLIYCINSFVSCKIYPGIRYGDNNTDNEEAGKTKKTTIRRTQCQYCRNKSPCMNAYKGGCSKNSSRFRCDTSSMLHLCNACGLRSGVSVDRECIKKLELEDGRVIPVKFHLAKVKRNCRRYQIKG